MSSKSEIQARKNDITNDPESATASLQWCLVDGDAAQLAQAHKRQRRSLLISVLGQVIALAMLVLVPILSKTERIALAKVMPLPPYHHAASASHTTARPRNVVPTRGFNFCLICPPVLPPTQPNSNNSPHEPLSAIVDGIPGTFECSDCANLIGKSNSQPLAPRDPTPKIVHFNHLDPAMIIHRVEPVFPTLARQTGREGTVELRAIIGTDGSVRSLQFLSGDPLFYQSARDAVSQWRYKPTVLNGNPVEVDTHITVIYRLNR